MTTSPAQAAASRANGAQSHGPATPEGRARSSQNARKHNIFGDIHLLSGEDQEQFNALSTALWNDLQPRTFLETRLFREMLDAEWRLQRTRAHAAQIQQNRMNSLAQDPGLDEAAQAFEALANEGRALQLLLRYESQFRRQFDKAFEQFQALRRDEQASQAKARRKQQEDQLRLLSQIINAPTPGERMGYAHCDIPDDTCEDDEAESQPQAKPAAASTTPNLRNEPSAPPRPAPTLAKTGTEG